MRKNTSYQVYIKKLRRKAIVICPTSLRENWKRELASAAIAATILSLKKNLAVRRSRGENRSSEISCT